MELTQGLEGLSGSGGQKVAFGWRQAERRGGRGLSALLFNRRPCHSPHQAEATAHQSLPWT